MTARRPVPGASPLTSAQVYRIMATRAVLVPLATTEVTDMCQAAYPGYENVTNYRVLKLLRYLHRRDRVTALHGGRDTELLVRLGIAVPHKQWLYWRAAPAYPTVTTPPLADQPLRDDLPMAGDGREPFPVTDNLADAPWGAVLELTDSGRPGWWQRQDTEWIPVEQPGRRDT